LFVRKLNYYLYVGCIGTFSKSSKLVRPRRPFAKDISVLDYDNDSDSEWEESNVEDLDNGEEVSGEDDYNYEVDKDYL